MEHRVHAPRTFAHRSSLSSPPGAGCEPTPVYRHMVVCLQRCARTAAVHALDALRRAEKRITENFRVPPHGG